MPFIAVSDMTAARIRQWQQDRLQFDRDVDGRGELDDATLVGLDEEASGLVAALDVPAADPAGQWMRYRDVVEQANRAVDDILSAYRQADPDSGLSDERLTEMLLLLVNVLGAYLAGEADTVEDAVAVCYAAEDGADPATLLRRIFGFDM